MTPTGVQPSRMMQTVFLFPSLLLQEKIREQIQEWLRFSQVVDSNVRLSILQKAKASHGNRSAVSTNPGGQGSHRRGAGGCKPHQDWKSWQLQKPWLTQGPSHKRWGAGGGVSHTPKEGRAAAILVMHLHGNVLPILDQGEDLLEISSPVSPILVT